MRSSEVQQVCKEFAYEVRFCATFIFVSTVYKLILMTTLEEWKWHCCNENAEWKGSPCFERGRAGCKKVVVFIREMFFQDRNRDVLHCSRLFSVYSVEWRLN